jgi:hypothetical protein
MVYTKTEEQVGLMKEAALLVSQTLTEVAKLKSLKANEFIQ